MLSAAGRARVLWFALAAAGWAHHGTGQLQLVALNTNLYLETNMVTRHSYQHDPADQWHWLQRTLKRARDKHKTVIIFGHSPPGVFERDWSSPGTHWLQHSHNIRCVALLLRLSMKNNI